MYDLIRAILSLMNSVGAGVMANYITPIIRRWLDSKFSR